MKLLQSDHGKDEATLAYPYARFQFVRYLSEILYRWYITGENTSKGLQALHQHGRTRKLLQTYITRFYLQTKAHQPAAEFYDRGRPLVHLRIGHSCGHDQLVGHPLPSAWRTQHAPAKGPSSQAHDAGYRRHCHHLVRHSVCALPLFPDGTQFLRADDAHWFSDL